MSSIGSFFFNIVGNYEGARGAWLKFKNETEMSAADLAKKVGTQMTVAGGAITGVLGFAVRDAGRFGSEMAKISTMGVKDLKALGDGVKDVAMRYGVDLTEATTQAYEAMSAGISEDAAVMILGAAAKGAAAGMGSLSDAVDLGTSVMNAYGLHTADANEETKRFENIMGQAATAVKLGKLTMADLGGVLGQVAPIFKTAGISTEEMFAAVSALTSTGLPASQAMNAMRAAVSNILKPSKEAEEAAAKLGIEFNAASLEARGLTGTLEDIRKAVDKQAPGLMKEYQALKETQQALQAKIKTLQEGSAEYGKTQTELNKTTKKMDDLKVGSGNTTTAIAQLFGSVEGMGVILALTGSQAESYTAALEEMGAASENLSKMFDARITNDPTIRWKMFTATMQRLSVEIGEGLIPALTWLGNAVKPVIQAFVSFMQHNEGLTKVITVLAGALGALMIVLGPILVVMGSLTTTIGGITAAFGVLAGGAGIGALMSGLVALLPAAGAVLAVLALFAPVIARHVRAIREHEEAKERQIESNKRLGDSLDKLAVQYEAEGIALDRSRMAQMSHDEQAAYLNQRRAESTELNAALEIRALTGVDATREQIHRAELARIGLDVDAKTAARIALSDITTQEIKELRLKDEAHLQSLIAQAQADQQAAQQKIDTEQQAAAQQASAADQSALALSNAAGRVAAAEQAAALQRMGVKITAEQILANIDKAAVEQKARAAEQKTQIDQQAAQAEDGWTGNNLRMKARYSQAQLQASYATETAARMRIQSQANETQQASALTQEQIAMLEKTIPGFAAHYAQRQAMGQQFSALEIATMQQLAKEKDAHQTKSEGIAEREKKNLETVTQAQQDSLQRALDSLSGYTDKLDDMTGDARQKLMRFSLDHHESPSVNELLAQSLGASKNHIAGAVNHINSTTAAMRQHWTAEFNAMSTEAARIFDDVARRAESMVAYLNSLNNGGAPVGPTPMPYAPTVPRFASGGTVRKSGLTITGENGPELGFMPEGTRVVSNNESRQMIADAVRAGMRDAGGPARGSVAFHVNIPDAQIKSDLDLQEVSEKICRNVLFKMRAAGVALPE